jgi:GTP cyclohydrolase I
MKLGIETPIGTKLTGFDRQGSRQTLIESNIVQILTCLNLNVMDDSLQRTPHRVAKMYLEELFRGLNYNNFPEMSSFQNKMKIDEMITSTCRVLSTCEHHLVPFIGMAYIGYIPKTRIIGLSKFNRIVDFFSRRPQLQERLTEQVSATLKLILGSEDVAVVIRCEHYCVKIRGVRDDTSITTTSSMGGRFLSNPAARGEFLALTR